MKFFYLLLLSFWAQNAASSIYHVEISSDENVPDLSILVQESLLSPPPPTFTLQTFNLIPPEEVNYLIDLRATGNLRAIMDNHPYILFLVDPQYDGNNKSSAVWAVGAFEKLPLSRPLVDGISLMDMVKGKFDQKLTKFVIEINGYRDEVHS